MYYHSEHDIIQDGTIAQLGERATEVRKVAGSIPARPITFCIFPHTAHGKMTSIWPSLFIPDGTIAQLGERAIEVRKVAGSIPARPIIFLHFCLLLDRPMHGSLALKVIVSIWPTIFIPDGTIAQLGERATEVRKVAGSIPARPITFCIFVAQSLGYHQVGRFSERAQDGSLIKSSACPILSSFFFQHPFKLDKPSYIMY
ncbi:hypothetical protein N7453_001673 [Penicillium expansum]|nr:hypothetical protein N7453_001673 [Penicillium expansum]